MRKSFLLTIALAATAYMALPMPGISSSLPQKIDTKRKQIQQRKAREGVLTTQLTAYRLRIRSLQGDIRGLQDRQNRVQVSLNKEQAQLTAIRDDLQRSRDRLTMLRAKLAAQKRLLAARLVAIYKDQEPDLVTVVLESNGFNDLLEQAQYIERISNQDESVVTRVRDTTNEVTKETKRLAGLEQRQKAITDSVLAKRNEIADAKQTVIARQNDLVQARDVRARALDRVRSHRHDLEGELNVLEAKQAKITARLRAASGSVGGGPIRRGSGQFIWPVNGPVVSGFGIRTLGGTTRPHQGIDIAAGMGTPIHAAAAGTVALQQGEGSSGGYGNFTCVQHSGSISTCYAHQSRFAVGPGTHVSQGQVIGYVGCTGHCFGPHLHFEVRINGTPVDPLGYL